MKILVAALLALHGLLHLLGFAKAFGIAALPQLTRPISRLAGLAWLLAALLFVATAALLATWPRGAWAIGAAAIVVSQLVIVGSWRDAKAGTLANLIALGAVALAFLTEGPTSPRAAYEREVARALAGRGPTTPAAPLTRAALGRLPPPVRRHLEHAGALGRPPIESFRARLRGEIRGGPNEPWMPFVAEQVNTYGAHPNRLFLMDARRSGLPVQAFHRYVEDQATMRVQIAGLVTVVDAAGPEMTTSETVTLFNDLCLFAPGRLADPAIGWTQIDERTAEATYSNAGRTIHARLVVDDSGRLLDFVSDDRRAAAPDMKSFTRMRWSTPLTGQRRFGPWLLWATGEGLWHAPAGTYPYIRLELLEFEANPRGRFGAPP